MCHVKEIDIIEFDLLYIDTKVVRDGIEFMDCMLVNCKINDVSVFEDHYFANALAVHEEILNSEKGNGGYLIFTCACGIADDCGWLMTDVVWEDDLVTWTVSRSGDNRVYQFDKSNYINQIKELRQKAFAARELGKTIEPKNYVPPEM